MTIGVYDLGEPRRLDAAFTSAEGAAADPTTVTLRITKPSGAVITDNYGSPSAIARTGTGTYYYDATLDEVGSWRWQWEGTGAVGVIEPGQLEVRGNGF